ncbi:hypothetical protein B0H14DRAFT_2623511 [Mycena olivaceomarginata]|nr:hypothetical protein B0H14DRAFT_2623511 [Mycena olivaceomarginata]
MSNLAEMLVRAKKMVRFHYIIAKIVGAVTGEDGSTVTMGLQTQKAFCIWHKTEQLDTRAERELDMGVDRIIGINLRAGSSSNPACHRTTVLQQSLPASSESSLSTVMRVDGQAKLEEHCGMFITKCVDAVSGIALWVVLWCKRCKSDIKNKYRPPDDEKVRHIVHQEQNSTHSPSERSTRKTQPLYHNGLRTSFDSFNLLSSTHSL